MSVVFDFNASLNGFTPVSPILFPVNAMREEKKVFVGECYFMCFLSFVFTTQIEFSECCV